MTEPRDDEELQQDDGDNVEITEPEPYEPEDGQDQRGRPELEYDPITAPNPDPAARSEHELNAERAGQYVL
jgi:hypothetical protein